MNDNIYEFDAEITVEKYYNSDSVWGCYLFKTETPLPNAEPSKNYLLLDKDKENAKQFYHSTLVGKVQRLYPNTPYKIKAKLEPNKKYGGWQYQVISAETETPRTLDSQKNFLLSICTESQVNTLLESYPDLVEGVVSGKYDTIDLSKTKGIKEYYWNLIKTRILENYVMADILSMLIPLGVSYAKVKRLFADEPNPLILKQRLLDDPYVIVDVPGITFAQADKIAIKLNPNLLVSTKRVTAFLKNYLREVGEELGHTWVSKNTLDLAVKENILECEQVYETIIEEEKENDKILHIEDDKIGLKFYYSVELKIWKKINLIKDDEPLSISEEQIEKGIERAEQKQGFSFTDEQKEILRNATKNNLVIITGKAGVGKTTIARGLLNIYELYKIGACALSAKAAKRITEVTGFSAMTIHRLLGAQGPNQFTYDEYNPLPYDVVFLDESSMVFSGLFWYLLRAIKPGAKLIICGDVAQLPPIGYGLPFGDILNSGIEVNRLTKILRQAEQSGIVSNANLVREGEDPLNGQKSFKMVRGELQDLYYMFRSDKNELQQIAIKTYLKTIEDPKVGIDNCFILTTRKDNATNSSREINKIIQDKLLGDDVPFIEYGKFKKIKLGARCLHVINDYEKNTFNGDMGVATAIYKDENGDEVLEVTYPEKVTTYYKNELNQLELAYVLTCHKFQGSEAKVIIGLIDNSGYMLLDRTMLYTLLTRGKERVLLLAEPYAYDRSIQEDKTGTRNTWMQEIIKKESQQ